MPTFDTPGKVAIRVGIGGGHVSFDTVDGATTTVDVEALRDDEITREAIDAMTIEARDRGDHHEIVVEGPKRHGGWLAGLGRGPKIGVRVRCPHGSDVRVSTSSADVEADGRFGDVEANTASGDLTFDVVDGTLKMNSASGDIIAREVGSTGSIKTASGDVRVDRARGSLSVNAVSGDVEVGEAHGDISVATVSGDQEISSLRGGEHAKVQSVSGDVRVGVAPGLRLWIDGSSVSGSLRSELDLEDDPVAEESSGADGPVVELRARTVSGDVQIVRGAPVL
jgi:DUF4097 and DUF4098 domain-containing protein YvlB